MASPETEIADAHQAWTQSVLANDADLIGELLSDDGVLVTPDGGVTAEQFLGAIRVSALAHTRMHAARSPDGAPRLRFYGNTATLTQRVVSTEVADGHSRDNDEWTTTVFVRGDDDRWRVALIHLTPAR